MRFVAACMVFVSHVAGNRIFGDGDTNDTFFDLFNPAGWMGVGFFFILSGFVLTWSARDDDTVRSFWRRRMVKIFPNHLVTWFAGLVLMIVTGEVLNAFHAIPSAFLVHTWIPRMDALTGTNGPSWSLCCELVFYLAFPYLHRLVKKIRPEHLWWWAAGTVTAIAAWAALVYTTFPKEPGIIWAPMPFWHFWAIYNPPPIRMLDFVLGILLARMVITGRWIPIGWTATTILVLAGYGAMLVVPPEFGMMAVTALPLAALIAQAATTDLTCAPSPFRGRVMTWLGEVSFAFYMVHYLILHFLLKAIGPQQWSVLEGLTVSLAIFLVTLLAAHLLYRHVEVPAMRAWARPRTAPARQAPAPTEAIPRQRTSVLL